MTPTTPSKKPRRRGPRGWLLVEVSIGGVMVSVILGALLVNIGSAMDKTTVSSRKLTAQMLAKQAIEQTRGMTNAVGVLEDGTSDVPVPSNVRGNYTRTRTITSGTETIGSLSIRYKDVAVSVAFPNEGVTKTVALHTRIYSGS